MVLIWEVFIQKVRVGWHSYGNTNSVSGLHRVGMVVKVTLALTVPSCLSDLLIQQSVGLLQSPVKVKNGSLAEETIVELTVELLPLKQSPASRESCCIPKQLSVHALNELKFSSFHRPK